MERLANRQAWHQDRVSERERQPAISYVFARDCRRAELGPQADHRFAAAEGRLQGQDHGRAAR